MLEIGGKKKCVHASLFQRYVLFSYFLCNILEEAQEGACPPDKSKISFSMFSNRHWLYDSNHNSKMAAC